MNAVKASTKKCSERAEDLFLIAAFSDSNFEGKGKLGKMFRQENYIRGRKPPRSLLDERLDGFEIVLSLVRAEVRLEENEVHETLNVTMKIRAGRPCQR